MHFISFILFCSAFACLSHLNVFGKNPNEEKRPDNTSYHSDIVFFTTTKPFDGYAESQQRMALESWILLSPRPRIVVFGQKSDFHLLQICEQYGLELEDQFDSNFKGVPLLSSMLLRAQSSRENIRVLINSDIILTPEFLIGISHISEIYSSWLAFGTRWDVISRSNRIPSLGHMPRLRYFWENTRRHHAQNFGTLHTYGGMDWWAWNANLNSSLTSERIPPLTFGRAKTDNWLTHHVIRKGDRDIVDASDAITSIHYKHSYTNPKRSFSSNPPFKMNKVFVNTEEQNFWSSVKQVDWETHLNIHLAMNFGTYSNQRGTALYARWKLSNCIKDELCLVKRIRPSLCDCESSSHWMQCQNDPKRKHDRIVCKYLSVDWKKDFEILSSYPEYVSEGRQGFPHKLSDILNYFVSLKQPLSIIFLPISKKNIDVLWDISCKVKSFKIYHLVVIALDEEVYYQSYIRGLAVYLHKFRSNVCVDSGIPCDQEILSSLMHASSLALQLSLSHLWLIFKAPNELLLYNPSDKTESTWKCLKSTQFQVFDHNAYSETYFRALARICNMVAISFESMFSDHTAMFFNSSIGSCEWPWVAIRA